MLAASAIPANSVHLAQHKQGAPPVKPITPALYFRKAVSKTALMFHPMNLVSRVPLDHFQSPPADVPLQFLVMESPNSNTSYPCTAR